MQKSDKSFLLKSGLYGAVTAFSFAPFNVFPVFLITHAWLLLHIRRTNSVKSMLKSVFCFFFFMHIGCLYWIIFPLRFSSEHRILAPLAITLIPAYLSSFLLIPALITKKVGKPMVFSSSFTLTMFFCGNFPLGFPWVLPGYIWSYHEVFLQTLSLYGIYGLTFVTLFISELTSLSFVYYKTGDTKKFRKNVAILTSLFLFILLFGIIRLTSYPTQFTDKKVRIVQGNIPQEDKNNSSLSLSNLNEHLKLSYHTNKLDFIIWPEASIPYLYKENSVHLHEYLRSPLQENEYLVAGAVRKDLFTGKVHNSIVVIDHNGHNVAKYDKIRLLPFGEYIPFRKYLPFQSIASDIGDFDVGERSNILTIKGMKIVLAICYEAVFPARFAHLSNDIDLIVNVTNDGWFGFTTEPFQHLQIVRARAIETGIPLIRVTNYGISAVYDPCGREITKISINESNAREVNIPLRIICTN